MRERLSTALRVGIASLLAVAVTPAIIAPAPASAVAVVSSPTVVLVVDISGSMDETDPAGTVKIEGAKRALLNLLQGLPAATMVGLHPYPSDGGCGPGSTVSGLDSDSEGLRVAIAGLSAGGNTPTGPALRAAADSIIAVGGPATMVLVSDGESNCGPPACDVAKQVAAEGIEITVNTVGFEISGNGADELKCIAEATGGRYFDAADSVALQNSLVDAATPRMSIVVEQPRPDEVIGAGAVLTVAATVTNISDHRLDDVRTLLMFPHPDAGEPENLDPGIAGAIKYLGNLAKGERRRVEWQYRVAPSQDGGSSSMVIHATAANAAPANVAVRVSYGDALDLSSAGPLLRDATRAAILGDSYSSGEGSGDYYLETNFPGFNSCHRSDNTYAMSLWEREPLLLACSGATTDNVHGPNPDNHEPSQIDRLAVEQQRDPVDLVLLTIGGNDIGFESIIASCVLWSQCHQIRFPTDGGIAKLKDCLDAQFDVATLVINQVFGRSGLEACAPSISFRDLTIASIDLVKDKLSTAYVAIDSTVNSPSALADRDGKVAPIIVLAYPNLMPYHAGSSSQGFCSRFLSEEEVRFGSDVADKLNATIKSVVEAEREQGLPIYFADDVADALRPSHTICDAHPHAVREVLWRTATGLVETLTPSGLQVLFRQATGGAQQEQLHPNKEGYRDVTAQLVRWSNTTKALEPVQRNRPNPWDPIPLGPYAGPLELTPSPESVTLLQPASTVTLQGAGFAPTNAVRITVHSVPTVLGTAFADADGGIELTALIPANLAPGEHLIVATGMDPNGRPYQIYSRIEIRRPVPWSNITLWITSVVLVLLTAPVVIAYLRQRTRRQAASPPSPTV